MTYGRIEEALRQHLSVRAADGDACKALNLYRYAAGDATPEERTAFAAHLESCAYCRADLAAFNALADQAEAPRSWRQLVLSWRLAPAFAVLVVIAAVGLWRTSAIFEHPGDGFRIKGGYRLHVAVERQGHHFAAAPGQPLQAGDALGFFYTAPQPTYVVILAASGGDISEAFPTDAEPRRLAAGSELRLPAGAVVEPGEGCEYLVAFFSDSPPDVDTLRDWLESAMSDARPDCTLPTTPLAHVTIDVFVVEREMP